MLRLVRLPASRSRRVSALMLALCIAVLLFQQGARALPQATDALRFFNNFFVTGGYVVGGVGLWNTGSGSINLSNPAPPMVAAPSGADVLATYLYWQVVTNVNPGVVDIHNTATFTATFNGVPLNETLVANLPPTPAGVTTTNACPLNGGSANKVYTFRADVQKFLDVDSSGKRVINKQGGYPVSLPNNGTARTLGASVVMIYRSPNTATPLSAVVLYDGTYVKQQPGTLNQRIEGFYDAASVNGQITYIAGSAQSNLNELLRIDTDGNPATVPAGTASLFDGASGEAWDTVTRQTAPLTLNARALGYLDTSISPQTTGPLGFLVNDCVSMGAMIYQTQVNDTDEDGLLNRWESSTSLLDPHGNPLPNFPGMGALAGTPDVFIEIAAMAAAAGTTYGSEQFPLKTSLPSVTDPFGHIHMPTPTVIRMLGEAYGAKGIRLHVDVGDPQDYHDLVPPNLVSLPPGTPNPYASIEADQYIIGAGGLSGNDPSLAKGGELIPETACDPGEVQVDHDGDPGTSPITVNVDCQFPDYPGTVSWKRGFVLFKEAVFDKNRKDSFRFGLYAHAKATPKSLLPCEGTMGPAGFNEDGNCESGVPNPLIHVPSGVSGTAEYPGGGDYLVTLGLWDNSNFVGNDFGIASTTMHELGHTFGLGHGGEPLPNCKPNYLSVMNYMFQLGGLIDATGGPNLGYSEIDYNDVDENNGLNESYTVPGLYRTSWYAPWSAGDAGEPVKRFCNGLKFPDGTQSMIRVDGTVGGEIDWNNDGDTGDSGLSQDVNFDGEPDLEPGGPTTLLTGFNDWDALRLNQVGSRRNFAGISAGPMGVEFLADGSELLADGSRITEDGAWLLADGSELLADGAEFLADGTVFLADGVEFLADGSTVFEDGSQVFNDGSWLLADGAELLADGATLLSSGSELLADGSVFLRGVEFLADGSVILGDGVELLADGAVFLSDGSPLLADGAQAWAWTINEPTPKSAAETGNTPGPTSLTATVIPDAGQFFHRIKLDWNAPLGDIAAYRVYREAGDSVRAIDANEISVSPVDGSMTEVIDTDELPNGEFTYLVVGVLDDEGGTVTPPSNQFTVLAVNDKPVANPLSVIAWEDFLTDPTITLAGLDPDSADVAFIVVGTSTAGGAVTPAGMVTPEANGTFTLPVVYLSALNDNGSDSFTFKLREASTWNDPTDNPDVDVNQESDAATVSVTVTPVNDRPSFTKGPNQTVTQPVGMQTVAGWVAGFDPGPRPCSGSCVHEDTQLPLAYIVSNNNTGLFDGASGQPAIAANGTLTYTPKAGASGTATVTVRVRDNGGTDDLHNGFDTSDPAETFTITVLPSPGTLLSFPGGVDAWMTTSTLNRKFDVKAQVLRNGVVVAQKEITNVVIGMGSAFSKAVNTQIQPMIPTTSFAFTTTDTLSVKLWVKLASSSGGGNSASAEVRFWYNTPGINSHLHVTRAGTTIDYYLVNLFKLQPNPPQAAGGTLFISLNVKQGEGYKAFGTWSITGP